MRVGARTGSARRAIRHLVLVLALALAPGTAAAGGPLYFLDTSSPSGDAIANLTWGLIALSLAVVVIISALVVVGVFLKRGRRDFAGERRLPVLHAGGGLTWVYIGLIVTTIALAGSITWTVVTMAAISQPPAEPRFTIEVTGQQWWWEVRYVVEDDPSRTFETANEIHLPVGEPVRVRLSSKDVIHSFWVPALAGKTDLVPGLTNVTWLQADQEGEYWGQCAEYCGRQHAHMALRVFAQTPEDFQAWWDGQVESADPPESEAMQTAQNQFILRCGACHAVRGTRAGGNVGPDLTHLMSRTTLAAGMLPNTVGHLSGWVANPQFIKPGSEMPNLELSGPQLDAIRTYLLTLD